MGQNIGAGRSERGQSGVYLAARMGAMWALCWGALSWFSSRPLLAIFNMNDPHVAEYGAALLRYLAFSGVFLAMALALTGGLMGAGETKKPMWIAIISQIGVLLGVCHLLQVSHLLTTNTIWLAILISHTSRYFLTLYAFRRTRWHVVQVEPAR
jgi:Na+-driven multidrug efflux pump